MKKEDQSAAQESELRDAFEAILRKRGIPDDYVIRLGEYYVRDDISTRWEYFQYGAAIGPQPPITKDAPAPAQDGVEDVAILEEIAEALDDALGDSDITHIETDEELRGEEPVQWACMQLNKLLQQYRK